MTLKTTKLRNAITFAIAASATTVAGTNVVFAQDASGQQATELDRIEVTGSRIKRADFEGALPVVVLDRAQIESSGDISVADFLRDTSFNSFGSFQTTSGSSAAGATGISLRGLGEGRTLILIDGRRAPTAPMTGSYQDLNSIPMAAVERVEVLSDGASAVYGSDALGGVVNIITRKDFDGAEITYGVGRPSNPGGDTVEGSVLIGASGDRGRVLGGASYNKRDIIFTRDRDYWYSSPGTSVYSNNFALSRSTAASQRLTHPEYGTAVPGLCTNGDDSDLFYQSANGVCQFNHSATSADLTSTENKSVFLHGDYQISDDWSFYFATSVTKTEAFGRYAPVPSSPWPGGAIILEAGSPNHPGTIGGNNPDAADPYYQSLTGQDLFLFHRFAALGNRDGRVENTTSSFLGGFEGRIGEVELDIGARHVESRATDIGQNYVVGGAAQSAISSGDYNIYDPYSADPDVVKAFTATIIRDMKTTAKEFYGNAAFDLFEMAGGTAAAVVGAEYREEYYQDNYDPLSESGQIVGSAGSSASGTRDVYATYFEALFPIWDKFEVNVAGRYDRYSDYGSDFAPKASLRWQPLDTLTLRASYGEGFRAPSLDILSAQPAFSAAFVTDRQTCLMLTGQAACEIQTNTYSIAQDGLESEQSKQFGFGAVWDATDWLNLTLDYYDIEIENSLQFVSIERVADCLRGVESVCPSGLTEFPAGTVLPNPALGLGAQFDPDTGGIVNGQTGTTNIGWIETSGFDFTARSNFDFAAGRLRNTLSFGYVKNYSANGEQNVSGRPGTPRIRASLANQWSTGDWDFIWNVSYIHRTQSDAYRNWLTTLRNAPNPADYADPADYQDALVTRDEDLEYFSSFPSHIRSYLNHDLQVNYRAPWNATITLGVRNVADRDPSYDISTGGASYDSTLYDPWGRVPYVRYTQRF